MKKRMLLGCLLLVLSFSVLMAQNFPDGVVAAFKKGSSKELAQFLSEKVSLVTPGGRPENLDKGKATGKLQEFLTTHKVSSFAVNHQGTRNGSSFLVGTLQTAKGKFRVNCFLKKMNNQCLIHQIRIEKINE